MLSDIRDYGLVWQRKVRNHQACIFSRPDNIQATPRRFSPTRLATTLTSSLPPLPTATGSGESKGEGFIVLETNYRIYAYTGPLILRISRTNLNRFYWHLSDNPLQTAVLNLFINLKSRFPNLVVGSITRDSVKRALMNGITADQVSCFNIHAMKERMLITKFTPDSDHQLLDHPRASSDEEECEYFRRPRAVHLLHHMWSCSGR